jgi:hypothetical protein
VALTLEGKFAGEGLQSIDEDDHMLSAMARELVERNGIGETADAVWKALNREHHELFAGSSNPKLKGSSINLPVPRPDPANLVEEAMDTASIVSSDSNHAHSLESGEQGRLRPSNRPYSA